MTPGATTRVRRSPDVFYNSAHLWPDGHPPLGYIVSNHSHPLKRIVNLVIMLVAVILVVLVLWQNRNGILQPKMSPEVAANTASRIAPVGSVYAGEAGATTVAEVAAAAEAALIAAAAQSGGAYGGTTDGAVIFKELCSTCHETGANNSPKMTHADWNSRIAQGKDVLYQHAIEGFSSSPDKVMLPKGGNPTLTDEQVRIAVDWMLNNLR
jgi:cytochrome c5